MLRTAASVRTAVSQRAMERPANPSPMVEPPPGKVSSLKFLGSGGAVLLGGHLGFQPVGLVMLARTTQQVSFVDGHRRSPSWDKAGLPASFHCFGLGTSLVSFQRCSAKRVLPASSVALSISSRQRSSSSFLLAHSYHPNRAQTGMS